MVKQTKAQAKRSLDMIKKKLIILWQSGYVSTNDLVKITDITVKNKRKLG
jgi:hypothetical protein